MHQRNRSFLSTHADFPLDSRARTSHSPHALEDKNQGILASWQDVSAKADDSRAANLLTHEVCFFEGEVVSIGSGTAYSRSTTHA